MLTEKTVHTFHVYQRFLIIVTRDELNIIESLSNIFEITKIMGLLKVNVLIKERKSCIWSIHFYKPFRRDCHSIDIFEMSRFTPENYTNYMNTSVGDLFPPRQFKFHNCPLYISTFSTRPFIIIKKIDGKRHYDGIDVRILREIAKELYLIPVYKAPLDGKNRGSVVPPAGAIKMV